VVCPRHGSPHGCPAPVVVPPAPACRSLDAGRDGSGAGRWDETVEKKVSLDTGPEDMRWAILVVKGNAGY